ncbi:MAG: WecB/TagA/CpsF family glycosyltransferase [Lachnospiraceae bacterium]|nr:WecB/TagA/CpsF family glycosyltransferase [Lachnospiraceae bacterium]
MRKMEVLGITMQDLTLRESMKKVEQFLKERKASTIALITMKGLIIAQDSPVIKEWMSSLDMTIPIDADILRAADIHHHNRINDVEDDAFIVEFLKKMVRQKKTIYLLSQSEAGLKKMEDELKDAQDGLQIIGRCSLESLEHDDDFVINDINLKAPDVLISNLPSPVREEFLANHHMKMSVSVWLMIRADRDLRKKNRNLFKKMYNRIMKQWFHIRLDQYKEENENEEESEG